MGIFTRFKDIINSNINAMLDRAEDPEKMIKLMIREMEDTLVELKASCAGVMAESKKIRRHLEEVRSRQRHWEDRARLAVDKGRDGLAREALVEKRRFSRMADTLDEELMEHDGIVGRYQDDIRQLEDKIANAREKQRLLAHRHARAQQSRRAREEMRRADSHEAVARFEELESRIERMEAEAELVNFGKGQAMEEDFESLAKDDEIERELSELKAGKPGASGENADRP